MCRMYLRCGRCGMYSLGVGIRVARLGRREWKGGMRPKGEEGEGWRGIFGGRIRLGLGIAGDRANASIWSIPTGVRRLMLSIAGWRSQRSHVIVSIASNNGGLGLLTLRRPPRGQAPYKLSKLPRNPGRSGIRAKRSGSLPGTLKYVQRGSVGGGWFRQSSLRAGRVVCRLFT